MRLPLRFILFFLFSILAFLLGLGIVMVIVFEGLLPLAGIQSDDEFSAIFILIFLIALLGGGVLFSVYLTRPIWLVLRLIKQLRNRQYKVLPLTEQIYNKKGKVKKTYWLYQEVIVDLTSLAYILQDHEAKQQQLQLAKQEWIRGVSHDLKTPLSYVIGYSSLLAQPNYEWSEEEKGQFVQEILAKGEYMRELIGDLNQSFRFENAEQAIPLEPEVFSFHEFVQQVLADVANSPRAFNYHFDLSAAPDTSNALIKGDRKLLYRAFENIFMNAVMHNAEQTEIQAVISITDEKQIRVVITDNGCGIPEEVLARLHASQASTIKGRSSVQRMVGSEHGMGLLIARKMIEAHGGALTISSEAGKGTELQILLAQQTSD